MLAAKPSGKVVHVLAKVYTAIEKAFPELEDTLITLFLLNSVTKKPIQQWSFSDESTIGIGRSTDNNVVLYSSVVSRRHAELRKDGHDWSIVNLGTNGTYCDNQRIEKMPVKNGMTIRLARSGPALRVHLGPNPPSFDTESLPLKPDTPQDLLDDIAVKTHTEDLF